MDKRRVRFWILTAIVVGTVAATTAQERRVTTREVVAEIQKQVTGLISSHRLIGSTLDQVMLERVP